MAVSPVQHYLPGLGLQVYSVRNELERDAAGTLRAIRAAGYAQVELMRLDDARHVTSLARDLGLGVRSAFLDWTLLAQPDAATPARLDQALATARDLGLRHLVFGYIGKGRRETVAQLKAHAAAANAFGRRCRDAGLTLCYHLHSFEFAPLADGATTGWDVLLHELDPQLVPFELDVFWCAIARRDPVAMLRDLRGRVAQVHLKDLAAGTPVIFDEGAVPAAAFREVGAGSLDFPAILAACLETGVTQCHVEQDQSPDPLASIAASAAWLRTA
jgi:sugar phosphate isomerase/epimerase